MRKGGEGGLLCLALCIICSPYTLPPPLLHFIINLEWHKNLGGVGARGRGKPHTAIKADFLQLQDPIRVYSVGTTRGSWPLWMRIMARRGKSGRMG